jgi:Ca2+-binding RTX toxin-like protein
MKPDAGIIGGARHSRLEAYTRRHGILAFRDGGHPSVRTRRRTGQATAVTATVAAILFGRPSTGDDSLVGTDFGADTIVPWRATISSMGGPATFCSATEDRGSKISFGYQLLRRTMPRREPIPRVGVGIE